MTPLGAIARVTSGGTPDRGTPKYWGGSIPWVKTTLIQNVVINRQDIDETITEEGLKHSAAKVIPAGSVLMAMIGQGKTRGQVAILNTDAAINQNCAALTVNNGVDLAYVYQQLLYRYEELRTASNSSGQQNLNAALIRGFRIPMLDPEQQAAVGCVLTEWDAVVEKIERLIAAKQRRYAHELARVFKSARGSVMQLSQLLVESRLPDNQNDPSKRLTVRLHLKGVEVRDVRGTEAEGATGYFVRRAGQFIYGKQNISRGAIGIVPNALDGYCSSQDLPAFDVSDKVNAVWLLYWFSRASTYQRLEALSAGSGSKRLHPRELLKTPIRVPTRHVQNLMVAYLGDVRAEIALLERQAGQLRLQKRGLMQKLLTGEWHVPLQQEVAG